MTAENPELVQQLEKLKALSDKLHESKVCMSIYNMTLLLFSG